MTVSVGEHEQVNRLFSMCHVLKPLLYLNAAAWRSLYFKAKFYLTPTAKALFSSCESFLTVLNFVLTINKVHQHLKFEGEITS